jgi:excisionase family DNA binding protein
VSDLFLITPPEAAQLLNVSERSLENWRHRGAGPAFVRVSGRCIRYRHTDLLDWIDDRLRTSTVDPGREAA